MRDFDTGEVLERIPGSLRSMPDGQNCFWCERVLIKLKFEESQNREAVK